MWYVPTNNEILISNLLVEKGIQSIFHLNIYDLSNAFKVKVWYLDADNELIRNTKKTIIFIDNRNTERERYINFLHELSHYIQEHASFHYLSEHQVKYFEMKADHLIQYIAMPYFLIDNVFILDGVRGVANYFGVPLDLAQKRIDGIKNRIELFKWENISTRKNSQNIILGDTV